MILWESRYLSRRSAQRSRRLRRVTLSWAQGACPDRQSTRRFLDWTLSGGAQEQPWVSSGQLTASPADRANVRYLCSASKRRRSQIGQFQTPNNRTLFLSVPVDRAASAGGVQGTARLAGQVTGALAASILLSAGSVKSAAPIAFGIAALAAFASAAISWSNDR